MLHEVDADAQPTRPTAACWALPAAARCRSGPMREQWPPVLRLQHGEPAAGDLGQPAATEHTSIHWHGIRLPNAQDGVPYLTQPPVRPGESFTYEFAPPDTGTFFFHPHCDTAEQLGRGLAGVLIVEGDEPEPFDADLVVRDARLADRRCGRQLPAVHHRRGRGAAGTFGSVRRRSTAMPQSDARSAGRRRRPAAPPQPRQYAHDGARHRGRRGARCVAIDGNALPPLPLQVLAHRAGDAPRHRAAARRGRPERRACSTISPPSR